MRILVFVISYLRNYCKRQREWKDDIGAILFETFGYFKTNLGTNLNKCY